MKPGMKGESLSAVPLDSRPGMLFTGQVRWPPGTLPCMPPGRGSTISAGGTPPGGRLPAPSSELVGCVLSPRAGTAACRGAPCCCARCASRLKACRAASRVSQHSGVSALARGPEASEASARCCSERASGESEPPQRSALSPHTHASHAHLSGAGLVLVQLLQPALPVDLGRGMVLLPALLGQLRPHLAHYPADALHTCPGTGLRRGSWLVVPAAGSMLRRQIGNELAACGLAPRGQAGRQAAPRHSSRVADVLQALRALSTAVLPRCTSGAPVPCACHWRAQGMRAPSGRGAGCAPWPPCARRPRRS